MYPYTLFWEIDLYVLMIGLGLLAAIILFRVLSDKKKLPAKLFTFFLLVAVGSIFVGFFCALLFQSFYNYLASGVWRWQGMTFFGGLVGGVVCFVIFYFLIGHFVFKDKEHVLQFPSFASCAAPCIAAAHALGRVGCLFAGCCYGIKSDSFGLPMLIDGVWEKRVPTQLLEAIFLLLLMGVLLFLLLKKDSRYPLQIYLISYGVWRFGIEYLRDDPRGSSGISFLTPSQLTSLLLILVGVAGVLLYKYLYPKLLKRPKANDAQE